ncbi:hypothetical protein A1O3_10504 [Capronia epimyces CBS 606.96]|uniref:Uncharacterized protein n=1 Tax=Capronia epimyces CBS 606.96 TaxID=1182542 RepID=W9Y339_9EURO|nr:uncharacterized protein A1O3_10504 [Capronia epimyces CBS 606.96]EXJ76859.1 hypothetical protein A1O3_10504 [Capronia epimyces CBS 606.96]
MASQQKIRVGLIGLNAPYTDIPTGTNWAAHAHLPYLRQSSKYELVALQNSSTERALQAIRAYDLDPDRVKAYGTPEDLANDPNVDLVVCSVRADRHGGALIPSIKAGKDVYVEWPMEANHAKSRELTDLVRARGVRNVVGIQLGYTPLLTKIKTLIARGAIGRLESSTFLQTTEYSGSAVPSHLTYQLDRKVGSNPVTVTFPHALEIITEVLGMVSSHQSLLVNQYPEVDVVDPATREVVEKARPNDVPNQVVFDAVLESGVVLTYKLQNAATISPGAKTANDHARLPFLEWRIFGSKGEIRIQRFKTWSINAGTVNDEWEANIWRSEDGDWLEVKADPDEFQHLPIPARNIGRLYEAFAAGLDAQKGKEVWYPDFEHALKTHELLDDMYRKNGF